SGVPTFGLCDGELRQKTIRPPAALGLPRDFADAHEQHGGSDADLVAVSEPTLEHRRAVARAAGRRQAEPLAVDVGAVAALQVADLDPVAIHGDQAVTARD